MADTKDYPGLEAVISADHIEEKVRPRTNNRDGHGHIEGNALLVNKKGEIRKIPVPSSDPNDPLNFRPWEKYGLVFCCCWFSVMGLSVASGLGAILNVFFEMYTPQGYSADQVVLLITLPTLFIGLGKLTIHRFSTGYCTYMISSRKLHHSSSISRLWPSSHLSYLHGRPVRCQYRSSCAK